MICPYCKCSWSIRYGRLHKRPRRKCKVCGYQYTLPFIPARTLHNKQWRAARAKAASVE